MAGATGAKRGLSRDEILAKIAERKRGLEPEEIPEWGGAVFIRRLSMEALEESGYFSGEEEGTAAMTIRLLVACLSDAEGNGLFSPDDGPALMEAEAGIAMRLFAKAAKINGLSKKGLDEAVAAFGEARSEGNSSE